MLDFEIKEKEEKDKIKEKNKILEKQTQDLFDSVFNNDNGIKILKLLMISSGFNNSLSLTSMNIQKNIDPLQLAFNDGKQTLFKDILKLLNKDLLIKVLRDDR